MSNISQPNLDTSVSLRVHFSMKTKKPFSILKEELEKTAKIKPTPFTLKVVDHHLWLGITKKHQKIYSPNLHLEFIEDAKPSYIKAKFGPDPALWTMFMFLHFALALGMITTLVFIYANSVLNKGYQLQIGILVLLSCIWIFLYFFARYNRNRGRKQAMLLLKYVKDVI